MKIAIAADHGGYQLKEKIKHYLLHSGYEVEDFGTDSEKSVDYPTFAYNAAKAVQSKQCDRGIVCCGTGIGVCITANKVHGIRCALAHDVFSAEATRAHNDANMLALGGRVVGEGLALRIVQAWLTIPYEGGRHDHRIALIKEIEGEENEEGPSN